MQLNKLTSEKDLENISIKSLLIQLINELKKFKEDIKEIKYLFEKFLDFQ